MDLTIAWLAQGKVRVKQPGAPPRSLETQFGESIRERAVRAQQRHGWKTGGQGESFLAGAVLWGKVPKDPAAVRIAITSFCRGATPGQILYSLETNELCAVLAWENLGQEERRLWNKNDKRLSHLCVAPDGAVACSVQHQFGTANLAVRLNEESGYSEVTEGDSLDTAPHWIPGEERKLVFQSAGVARDRNGSFAGLGPFTIQTLNIDSGNLTTLVEDPKSDLLAPQITADGSLLYVRRPYVSGREFHPFRVLKDILLFPFRLIYAVFQFLQFFSIRYTGKKLTGAGGARSREMDMKEMMIWGNRVSAEHAQDQTGDAPGLVPNNWELVQQHKNSEPRVLAKGVLAYDLAADEAVVYTNGSAVYFRDASGKTECVCVERMIEQVAVLG